MLEWLKSLFGGAKAEETTEEQVAEPQAEASTEEAAPEAQAEEEQAQ